MKIIGCFFICREAFNVLDQSRKKIIITNDDFDFSTSTVQPLSLPHFSAMEQLE